MHVVKPTLKDAQSIRKMKRGKENSLVYNMGMVLFIKLHFLHLSIFTGSGFKEFLRKYEDAQRETSCFYSSLWFKNILVSSIVVFRIDSSNECTVLFGLSSSKSLSGTTWIQEQFCILTVSPFIDTLTG